MFSTLSQSPYRLHSPLNYVASLHRLFNCTGTLLPATTTTTTTSLSSLIRTFIILKTDVVTEYNVLLIASITKMSRTFIG